MQILSMTSSDSVRSRLRNGRLSRCSPSSLSLSLSHTAYTTSEYRFVAGQLRLFQHFHTSMLAYKHRLICMANTFILFVALASTRYFPASITSIFGHGNGEYDGERERQSKRSANETSAYYNCYLSLLISLPSSQDEIDTNMEREQVFHVPFALVRIRRRQTRISPSLSLRIN